MSTAAPAASGVKGTPMQQDTNLSSLAAGLPGYQATPSLPASPEPSGAAMTFLLTQVWQQGMQTRTDMAVMQATIGAIKQQTENIQHDLGARIKELEQARLTEVAQMGGMRADLATQIAQALSQVQGQQLQQGQVRSQNAAQWGSQLASAIIAGGVSLLGIVVTLLIVISQVHH